MRSFSSPLPACGDGSHFLPSPGGGGSARIARCETGWGDGLSTRAAFEGRDCHPTPIAARSTLPLQGRVRIKIVLDYSRPLRHHHVVDVHVGGEAPAVGER